MRSRYVGGSGADRIDDLTVGALTFDRVVVGGTASSDYPTTDGSTADLGAAPNCSECPLDAFVTNTTYSDGTVRWSRIIGGVGYDRATAVVANSNGVYIAGSTAGGIATTASAGDRTFAGGSTPERGPEDGFVCRLDEFTGATIWCSYVGGTGSGGISDVAVRNDVYATLHTAAGENLHLDPDYTAAFANGLRGLPQGADGVIVQLSVTDGHFVSATYVGGSGDEHGPSSIVFDGGYLHYLGGTASTDVPTPGGFLTAAPAGDNLFFTTYSPGLSGMQYGTYVGGDGDDTTSSNALAGWDDNTEVVGIGITTTSTNLPTRLGVVRATYGGDGPAGCGTGDGWLAVIRPTTTGDASLLSATYFGGSAGDHIGGVSAVLGSRAVLAITGQTASTDFPTMRGARTTWSGATCTMQPGVGEAFAALVDVDTGTYAGSFLGGSALDRGAAISFVTVAGVTGSPDFPTTQPGDSTLGGTSDGFITAFGPFPPTDGDGSSDATGGFESSVPGEGELAGGCCGTAPAPVAPAAAGLAGLVMLLVRRRRGR